MSTISELPFDVGVIMENKFDYNTGKCTCGYVAPRIGLTTCPLCGTTDQSRQVMSFIGIDKIFAHRFEINEDEIKAITNEELRPYGVNAQRGGIPRVIRPTFEQMYMRFALTVAERSTCSRRQVGCVITTKDYRRVLSIGYNGNASGLPNRCDKPEDTGACGCLHAEENACISCSESPYTPKILFTTVYPCKMCAKRIVQLGGVFRVFYYKDYHNTEAAEVFKQVGIFVTRVEL